MFKSFLKSTKTAPQRDLKDPSRRKLLALLTQAYRERAMLRFDLPEFTTRLKLKILQRPASGEAHAFLTVESPLDPVLRAWLQEPVSHSGILDLRSGQLSLEFQAARKIDEEGDFYLQLPYPTSYRFKPRRRSERKPLPKGSAYFCFKDDNAWCPVADLSDHGFCFESTKTTLREGLLIEGRLHVTGESSSFISGVIVRATSGRVAVSLIQKSPA